MLNKNIPKYLYKYRPINKNTIKLLLENEAYFSLPKDFNDPFDCNIIPRFIYTKKQLDRFFRNIKKREGYELFNEDIQHLQDNPESILRKHISYSIERIRNNIRVFCLSEVNNNVLLYAHYADGHKGICLEFEFNGDSFYDSINFVRYRRKYPVIHPFSKSRVDVELVIAEVLTKSFAWNYENEWRIIKDEGKSIYSFPSESLTSIIFGRFTPKEDKLLISNLVANRKPNIKLKEAFKLDDSFSLEIRPAIMD